MKGTSVTHPLEEMRSKLYKEPSTHTVRLIEARASEQRSASGAAELVIEGYAAVFDSPTIIDYGSVAFEEVIARGAFRKFLNTGADIICQADHCGEPLGRISNNTLTVQEDTRGVKYRCVLPDTNHGRDTWELVQRGDYPGCSFTFYINENGDTWERNAPRPANVKAADWWGRRIIAEFAEIIDIGPVTWPAYTDTTVQVAQPVEDLHDDAVDTAERSAVQRRRRARAAAMARRVTA